MLHIILKSQCCLGKLCFTMFQKKNGYANRSTWSSDVILKDCDNGIVLWENSLCYNIFSEQRAIRISEVSQLFYLKWRQSQHQPLRHGIHFIQEMNKENAYIMIADHCHKPSEQYKVYLLSN